MRGHVQEHAAEDTGPEGERLGQVTLEIPHLKFTLSQALVDKTGQTSGYVANDQPECNHGTGDVNHKLGHVCPDHGRHAAQIGVNDGGNAHDGDGNGHGQVIFG